MKKKVVLVTGASSGFGRGIVRAFLNKDFIVIASLRNAEQRKELFSCHEAHLDKSLFLLSLDVTCSNERALASEFISGRFGGRLDVLVNNAGHGTLGALEDFSDEQIAQQMNVNFIALAQLTRGLLPYIRAAQGRIINFSSIVGYAGMPLTSMYCASKHAVEGFSEALYHELKPHKVKVSVVEPGAFRTDFAQNTHFGQNFFSGDSAYRVESQLYQEMHEKIMSSANASIEEVLNTVLRLATMHRPPLRVRCGKDAKILYAIRKAMPDRLFTGLFGNFYAAYINRATRQSALSS